MSCICTDKTNYSKKKIRTPALINNLSVTQSCWLIDWFTDWLIHRWWMADTGVGVMSQWPGQLPQTTNSCTFLIQNPDFIYVINNLRSNQMLWIWVQYWKRGRLGRLKGKKVIFCFCFWVDLYNCLQVFDELWIIFIWYLQEKIITKNLKYDYNFYIYNHTCFCILQ